jgi:hypothetical protein
VKGFLESYEENGGDLYEGRKERREKTFLSTILLIHSS